MLSTSASGDIYPDWAYGGQLEANANGTRLVSVNNQGMLEVYDLDPGSGQISNRRAVHEGLSTWDASQQAWIGRSYYGASFSANGQLLYVSGDGSLFQYDLTAGGPLAIAASEIQLFATYDPSRQIGGLQRAPNGRIYAAQLGQGALAAVQQPNVLGTACAFAQNVLPLNGGFSRYSLPSRVVTFDTFDPAVDLGPDTLICPGTSLTLTINSSDPMVWSTGDTTTSVTVQNAGTYWVAVSTGCGMERDTIVVGLHDVPEVGIIPPYQLCPGQTVQGTTTGDPQFLYWNTGEQGATVLPSEDGLLTVSLDHVCGTAVDSAWIKIVPVPVNDLPSLFETCLEPVIITLNDSAIVDVIWSHGAHGASVALIDPGTYTALVMDTGSCQTAFSFTITENCPTLAFVPNSFTPNGDGINDSFGPVLSDRITEHSFTILDRWGQELFQSDARDRAWNGPNEFGPEASFVYVWELSYTWNDKGIARHRRERGHVTLVR